MMRLIFTKRRLILISAVLLASILVFTGCTSEKEETRNVETSGKETAQKNSDIKPSENKNTLLFDLAHREVFSPDDPSPRGQQKVYEYLKKYGFQVERNEKEFTPEVLSKTAAVYIPGPMTSFTPAEIRNLKKFVENGGAVILTVHVSYFMQDLLAEFGFQITGSPIHQKEYSFHNTDTDFLAPVVEASKLTEDVKSVAVMGTWGIRATTDKARVVVSTTQEAWSDLNGSGKLDEGDAQGSFGVVGFSELGKGIFILIADDAVFANALIENENNKKLLENISKIILGETGKGSV